MRLVDGVRVAGEAGLLGGGGGGALGEGVVVVVGEDDEARRGQGVVGALLVGAGDVGEGVAEGRLDEGIRVDLGAAAKECKLARVWDERI